MERNRNEKPISDQIKELETVELKSGMRGSYTGAAPIVPLRPYRGHHECTTFMGENIK